MKVEVKIEHFQMRDTLGATARYLSRFFLKSSMCFKAASSQLTVAGLTGGRDYYIPVIGSRGAARRFLIEPSTTRVRFVTFTPPNACLCRFSS
jgi:hypothetical protein